MAPRGDDGSTAPGAIVLLSDGMNTAGWSPLQGAAEAREAEVPVYTIAYGTENGSVDLDGKRERVPPDRDLMQSIAQSSGGATFAAESADDLSRVYENIRSEVGYEEVKKETTATWAGYGLAFAVLAALAAVSRGRGGHDGRRGPGPLISFFHPPAAVAAGGGAPAPAPVLRPAAAAAHAGAHPGHRTTSPR